MNLLDLARSALPLPVAALTADRWAVHFADREPLEVILPEPMTHAGILARYPAVVAAEPVARQFRRATDREAAEIRRLLDIILADESEEERAWSLAIACADPDAALMSFRALVAELQGERA